MTSTQWEHQREVREALRTIVSDPQLGVPALSNSQTMSNLLKDLLPDAPRETSVLVAAAEAGLPQVLTDHVSQGMDVATASSLTASSFASRTPFTPDACSWVVGELAVALGLLPEGGQGQPAPGLTPGPMAAVPAAAETLGPTMDPAGLRTQPPGGTGQPAYGQPGHGQPAYGQPGGYGQAQGQFGGQGSGFGQPGGYPGQAAFGQQAQFGQQQARFGGSGTQFGQAQGEFGGQTMPPTVGPGMPPGGPPTGPGAGAPGRTQRVPKFWAYLVGGLVAIAVIAAIIAAVQHHPSGGPPVEAASKIIKPDVKFCRPTSLSGLKGVKALDCATRVTSIGLSAYQFDNTTDYSAGLRTINSSTGWAPSGAGFGCPPPSGKPEGRAGWHTITNPKYKKQLSGQVLECYTPTHAASRLLYLWTLPTQRLILVAGDFSSSATFNDLENWWKNLTYG